MFLFPNCSAQRATCTLDAINCENLRVACVTSNQFKLLLVLGAFVGACYYVVKKQR